jgi:CheY-like chemotaxis protein
MKEINPDFGFQAIHKGERPDLFNKLESIALGSVRKRFSPEFVNRIDSVITYQPLDPESLATILDQQIAELQRHVNTRLGDRYFNIEVPFESRQFLLRKGTSAEYGARELKRTIHRFLTQPLATLVAAGKIEPGARIRIEVAEDKDQLSIRTLDHGAVRAPQHPTVLLVDDNRDLLRFLERLMAQAGWKLLTAESAQQAEQIIAAQMPNAALLDYLLPDGNGVELGVMLQRKSASVQVIIMTGAQLSAEEEAVCQEYDFPVLRKPFLANDILNLIRARLFRSSTAAV